MILIMIIIRMIIIVIIIIIIIIMMMVGPYTHPGTPQVPLQAPPGTPRGTAPKYKVCPEYV